MTSVCADDESNDEKRFTQTTSSTVSCMFWLFITNEMYSQWLKIRRDESERWKFVSTKMRSHNNDGNKLMNTRNMKSIFYPSKRRRVVKEAKGSIKTAVKMEKSSSF